MSHQMYFRKPHHSVVNCAVHSTILESLTIRWSIVQLIPQFFLITTKVTNLIPWTQQDLTQLSYCCFRCLNEFSFVCRSATYDAAAHTCSLSRFTRRTHPELLEDDPNCDYLENTCLNGTVSNIEQCLINHMHLSWVVHSQVTGAEGLTEKY